MRAFQIRVNQLQGYQALNITGTVDPNTMAYLNYYVEWWEENRPSATATPAPNLPTRTPAPTNSGVVDANSSREEIAAVQEMLERVGLLSRGDVDGVYGSGTATAVREFQNWVNQQRGENTLNVSGSVDALTPRLS